MEKDQKVEVFLIKQIKQRSDVARVEKDKSLEDNGVDSLDTIDIASVVYDKYLVDIPDCILYDKTKTVSDWLEFIETELKK